MKYLVNKKEKKIFNGIIPKYEVEQGSNYIKYPDGILICFGNKKYTYSTTDYWDLFNRSSYILQEFPIEFKGIPTINIMSNNFGVFSIVMEKITTKSFSFCGIQSKNNNQTSNEISYIAIGRWK